MRKTKIVCTLGPATDREGVLRQMLQAGMNVARFNFSHGSYDEHQRRLDQLVALREELHLPVAAMLDTKGPEVRLRSFQNGPVQLKTGQSFTLTTDDVPGDESRCSITYAQLPQDVKPGDTILLDDGLVRLTVLEDIPEKFHPGDVLVVPYTNNEVLPWLRQAAAIVSEEASADCHTATVGLLLNKPVIVAASDATRRLKDGTFVSVDCARGIVQVIPQ